LFKHLVIAALITFTSGLTGCNAINGQPVDSAASSNIGPSLPFTAQGNEPPWQLVITASHLKLTQGYQLKSQQFTMADKHQVGKKIRITGKNQALIVSLTPDICHDSMSAMPYPWQAKVTVAGKNLQGCAGEPLELLLGEWQIEDINGEGILNNSHLTLTFDDKGRVYGSASCNRYSSSYKLTGENLTFKPGLVTKMACPEALMNQEKKFLAIFNEINQFDINKNGALILKSHNGKTLRGYLLGQ